MTAERNVTENELAAYILKFHEVLDSTAQKYLPAEYVSRLRHGALLPARITCYASTQFGVAFEYAKAAETTIRTVRGSSRIEFVVMDVAPSVRKRPVLYRIGDFADVTMNRCSVSGGAVPFRLEGENTTITVSQFKWIVGDWERNLEYAEFYGDRRASRWTEAAAVGAADEEVLAATVELRRATERRLSLDRYIAERKEKAVLVLGSYSPEGTKRLAAIKRELVALGYDPLLLREVPDNAHQSLAQKVATLGHLARFVVIDDAEKSGHLVELSICEANRLVTIVLRPGGEPSSWMAAGQSIYSSVIREAAYDPPALATELRASVEWAESELARIEKSLGSYPWRLGESATQEPGISGA